MAKNINWGKLSQDYNKPENSPGFLLWLVSNKWQRKLKSHLSTLGLTHVQFIVLSNTAWLTRDGTKVNQNDIAKQVMIEKMMVSDVLKTLEKKGLIQRLCNEGDRREKAVVVTNQGIDMVNKAMPKVLEADKQFFSRVDDNLNQLITFLKLLNGLE